MPLHLAALYGHVSAIEELARLGASINVAIQGIGVTPLHAAAIGHRVGAIEALVALGASLEAKNSDGNTPLECAKDNSGDAARKKEAVAALERLCGAPSAAPTDGARE
jgi:ankyrin repeat protein